MAMVKRCEGLVYYTSCRPTEAGTEAVRAQDARTTPPERTPSSTLPLTLPYLTDRFCYHQPQPPRRQPVHSGGWLIRAAVPPSTYSFAIKKHIFA